MPYDKNFASAVADHFQSLGDAEPTKPGDNANVTSDPKSAGKSKLDDDILIRDLISNIVSKGSIDLKDQNTHHDFAVLSGLIGSDKARSFITQATIFNQRPESKKLTPEQRVQNFYSLGSKDDDLNKILQTSSNLSKGTLEGFRTTPLSSTGDAAQPSDAGQEAIKAIAANTK